MRTSKVFLHFVGIYRFAEIDWVVVFLFVRIGQNVICDVWEQFHFFEINEGDPFDCCLIGVRDLWHSGFCVPFEPALEDHSEAVKSSSPECVSLWFIFRNEERPTYFDLSAGFFFYLSFKSFLQSLIRLNTASWHVVVKPRFVIVFYEQNGVVSKNESCCTDSDVCIHYVHSPQFNAQLMQDLLKIADSDIQDDD